MNYSEIGKFIQQRRKELGLTQKDLANMIGVTDKAVSKWETGLGCPDISILEILSSKLNCSILELLKGRKINEEVIPVTEANDYIKTGLKYGENNFKRVLSKVIIFLLLFIFILLIIFNIVNICNQRKTYTYDFNSIHDKFTTKVDKIKNNIEVIKNNQGKFKKDDYESIINNLLKVEEEIDNNIFIKYQGVKILTINDLYVIDANNIEYMPIFNIMNILEKYDINTKNSLEEMLDSYGMRVFLGSPLMSESYTKSYRYEFSIPYNSSSSTSDDIYQLTARAYDINYTLTCYVKITNMIIEVGGINA